MISPFGTADYAFWWAGASVVSPYSVQHFGFVVGVDSPFFPPIGSHCAAHRQQNQSHSTSLLSLSTFCQPVCLRSSAHCHSSSFFILPAGSVKVPSVSTHDWMTHARLGESATTNHLEITTRRNQQRPASKDQHSPSNDLRDGSPVPPKTTAPTVTNQQRRSMIRSQQRASAPPLSRRFVTTHRFAARGLSSVSLARDSEFGESLDL